MCSIFCRLQSRLSIILGVRLPKRHVDVIASVARFGSLKSIHEQCLQFISARKTEQTASKRGLSVIVVFCGRKICLFPQFTASFIIFHETILVFTIFNPKLMVFRSSESQNRPFLSLSYISQSVLNWYTGSCPAVALHLNRVLSTFSFTCVTIDAVIYTACCYCYFQFVFATGVLFPCT